MPFTYYALVFRKYLIFQNNVRFNARLRIQPLLRRRLPSSVDVRIGKLFTYEMLHRITRNRAIRKVNAGYKPAGNLYREEYAQATESWRVGGTQMVEVARFFLIL